MPSYSETRDQSIQRQLDEANDYLGRIASGLRTKGYAVRIEAMVDDDIAGSIVKYAREMKPTFIVMLRTTSSAIGRRLFGSVASSVVNSDVAPVLLFPPAK
jgi:nucleotide-binding universal stress UspA family protein